MADETARHTLLLGLKIGDAEGYRQYREAMTPILERHGGRFGYDFVVGEVLRSEVDVPIDRVFTMVFPSREVRAAFFADPSYRRVRARYFEPSVLHVTRLAEF